MAKYFFRKDDELCFETEHHLRYMREHKISEMEVFEAKMEHGTGFFFCTELLSVGEVNGTCGKMCDNYTPRNGKNGRCKHSGNVYEKTEKAKLLKI